MSIALSLDEARERLQADDRAEVLPWRGNGLRVTLRKPGMFDPPEAFLRPTGEARCDGVVRVSWWMRYVAYLLPFLVLALLGNVVSGIDAGGVSGWLQAGWSAALAGGVYPAMVRQYRRAKRELRDLLGAVRHTHQVER